MSPCIDSLTAPHGGRGDRVGEGDTVHEPEPERVTVGLSATDTDTLAVGDAVKDGLLDIVGVGDDEQGTAISTALGDEYETVSPRPS